LTVCQVEIASVALAAAGNVLTNMVPCADDPANRCTTVAVTLAPGTYPFVLVCSGTPIVRSNKLVVPIGQ
jgi:hypothetical protein